MRVVLILCEADGALGLGAEKFFIDSATWMLHATPSFPLNFCSHYA